MVSQKYDNSFLGKMRIFDEMQYWLSMDFKP